MESKGLVGLIGCQLRPPANDAPIIDKKIQKSKNLYKCWLDKKCCCVTMRPMALNGINKYLIEIENINKQAGMLLHYYDIKYPFLSYRFREMDGTPMIMYSIPVVGLIQLYRRYVGGRPDSLFDCGCATGEIIRQAEEMGIMATGIDVKQYKIDDARCQKYFDCGRVQMRSILDYDMVSADIAYCNGTLTYLSCDTLPLALEKFKRVGMLVAIHNTTEDVRAAANMGWELLHNEPRLIRSKYWWMQTLRKNGFDVKYDAQYNCFCALPNQKTR